MSNLCAEVQTHEKLLLRSTNLVFKNCTICPHKALVFMCCVRFSQQTVIISLFNLTRLVFVTDNVSVYSETFTEFNPLNSN